MKLTIKLMGAAIIAILIAGCANISFEASYATVLGAGVLFGNLPIQNTLNSFIVPNIGELSLKMPQRRTRFGFACYKSDAGANDDPDKKQELLDTIKAQVQEQVKNKMDKPAVEEYVRSQMEVFKDLPNDFLRGLADPKTGVIAKLTALGSELEEIKRTRNAEEKPKTLKEIITEWHTANKDNIRALRDGDQSKVNTLKPMDIRAAASPMTVATVNAGASVYIPRPFIEAGINDILRNPPTFWDSIRKGRTNSETYVWVNKVNPQGAAAFIGPGVLKPGVSFALATEVSHAKKIAVSAKAATELLDDIDGIVDMIEGEMRYALFHELNSKLMTGVASSTVPAGIQTLSTTYTLTTLKTPNPNYMDAIRALVAQLRSGLLTGRVVVYINPIDAASMDLTKATTSGTYLLPPFVTADGRIIAGASIVEDINVTVGNVQAALIDYYQIKIYKDFAISQGWENDDFTRNLVTWVAEMRLHQMFNSAYTGAFIYDTFANITAALTPAP
jgi:hypothetical protein